MKKKSIDKGSRDNAFSIRKKIFSKDLRLIEVASDDSICSKCSIKEECDLYYNDEYKEFDKSCY